MSKEDPQLHLLRAAGTAEDLAKFFTALTGKNVTPEQIGKARELSEKFRRTADQQAT